MLFQCKFSGRKTFYMPSIPDKYFDHQMLASSLYTAANLTKTQEGTTYIFPIPPKSEKRNCSGIVRAIQYCYIIQTNAARNVPVFNFLYQISQPSDQNYRVERYFTVTSSPKGNICSRTRAQERICCEKKEIQSVNRFRIPSSEYLLGVEVNSITTVFPISFSSTSSQFNNYKQFEPLSLGNIIQEHTSFRPSKTDTNRPLLLMRLFLGKIMNLAVGFNYSSSPIQMLDQYCHHFCNLVTAIYIIMSMNNIHKLATTYFHKLCALIKAKLIF